MSFMKSEYIENLLKAGARPEGRVGQIEVRWRERTVMNYLKVYGSGLIQDGKVHTKSPTTR
jgi:hypothetical protein